MNFSLVKFTRNNKPTSQVIVKQPKPDGGEDTERLEASTNPNRAAGKALLVIDGVVRKALLAGKTIKLEYADEDEGDLVTKPESE